MSGCGCAKRANTLSHFMGREGSQIADPAEWGPILWKYLHCLAEKIGNTGNKIVDTDQANYFEQMLQQLPLIIPCQECQQHTAAYISSNHIPTLKGLYGEDLRNSARTWLFNFHNSVRQQKGQPIIINSIQDCINNYASCFVAQCEFTSLTQSVAYAVRHGWVRIDNWRRWFNNSERIKVLVGNIVL